MSDQDKMEQMRITNIKRATAIFNDAHNPKKVNPKTGVIEPMTLEEACNKGMIRTKDLLDAEKYYGYGEGGATEAFWSKKYDTFVHKIGGGSRTKNLKYFEQFVPMTSATMLSGHREITYEESLENYKLAAKAFDVADEAYNKAHIERQNKLMDKARAQAIFERKLKEQK